MAVELAADKESLLLNLLTQHIRAKVREHLMASVGDVVDAVLADGMKDFQAVAQRRLDDDAMHIVITTDTRKSSK